MVNKKCYHELKRVVFIGRLGMGGVRGNFVPERKRGIWVRYTWEHGDVVGGHAMCMGTWDGLAFGAGMYMEGQAFV